MATGTTWRCTACGHTVTLANGGWYGGMPNGRCYSTATGRHAYGEPVTMSPATRRALAHELPASDRTAGR